MDETAPDPMTKAQRDALKRAWDILTEHFEHVLLVADWEEENPADGKRCSCHEGWWHGGSITAIGLAEFAKDRILNIRTAYNDPEDPEDPE